MLSSVESLAPSADLPQSTSFAGFLNRVRAGDELAAVELVARFEPALRLEIKLRMGDPRLRRLLEPADISQSVLRSFFARAGAGQFDVQSPQQLLGLLLTMARNKVAIQARKQQAVKRDVRKLVSLQNEHATLIARDPSPSRQMMGRETLNELTARLSADDQRIAEMRGLGFDWKEIADELGGTAQSRRKQFARALQRAGAEIQQAEAAHE